jgi:outer membrane receptor for ferrienterochelin and colicins
LVPNVLGLSLYGSLHRRFDDLLVNGSLQDVGRDNLGGKLSWNITDNQNAALEISRNQYDSETGTDSDIDVDRMNYSLTHNLDWGNSYKTTSFINYEDVDFLNGDYSSAYSQLNLNSKTSLTFGQHDLTVGGDYRSEVTRHSAERIPAGTDPEMKRWNMALFGEDNWHVLDNFTATLGMRYDQNERYGSHFTPRVYGVWDMTESVILKGGMSGGYKVPQLKQADSNIIEPAGGGTGWDQGNTSLKPEESTNYELGVVWVSDLGLQFGVTAYHTRFSDKIDRERICDDPVGLTCNGRRYIARYVNRDAAELNGGRGDARFPGRRFRCFFELHIFRQQDHQRHECRPAVQQSAHPRSQSRPRLADDRTAQRLGTGRNIGARPMMLARARSRNMSSLISAPTTTSTSMSRRISASTMSETRPSTTIMWMGVGFISA